MNLRPFSFSLSIPKKEKGLGIIPGMPEFLFKEVGHWIAFSGIRMQIWYDLCAKNAM